MSRRHYVWHVILAILASVSVAAACSPATAAEDAEAPTAVVVYGDRDNGFALATLLIDVGISCKPVAYSDVTADWTTDADLVVFASCCPGGWRQDTVWNASLLDRVRTARVVACGDTGASLLQTKTLLVGHPNGAHFRPTRAAFSRDALGTAGAQLLSEPHVLDRKEGDQIWFSIQQPADVPATTGTPVDLPPEFIGIYDGGQFPTGTHGIARIYGEAHHWLICRQGNFTLWGADTLIDDMTEEGKQLLANLCWQLAHAAPEPLVFPEKSFVEDSVEGKLKAGSRGEFYHELSRTGRLTIRLAWKGDNTMMLMTHQAFTQRVDGGSPLTITQPVNDAMQQSHVEIEVGSFDLPEGEECPYEVTLDWED